jgi:predicted O-linked N-acetylglucosamine transferase (SPINDLY family)
MPPPPANLKTQLQQALAQHQAGRYAPAAALYAQVRKAAPQLFDAWHLGGMALFQLGRAEEALPLLTRALQINPRSAPGWLRLGLARAALGQTESAVTALRRALELDPAAFDAWLQLSILLERAGEGEAALEAAARAATLRPDHADAHDRVAVLTSELRGMGAAHPLFRRATERWPTHARSWQNLGVALATLHEADAALAALDRALELDPSLVVARIGRGLALQEAFRVREALVEYERVLLSDPAQPSAGSARLLCLNYLEDRSPAQLHAAHLEYGRAQRAVAAALPPPPALRRRERAGPLRVAVLSQDFRRHAVAAFFEPLVEHIDPTRIELFLYHDHAHVDEVSARLKARARLWRNFAGWPDGRVEAAVRGDAPDVLVDLSGHTGRNRLPLFARRLAPVQVSYLGYPNTTGLAEMDFRLSDAWADPSGLTDGWHSERLVRFASCAWTYRPAADAPAVSLPAGPREGGRVVFGSFNNAAKLSDFTLRLWARVLGAVPGATLLLKGHGLESPARAGELRARCAAAGIDSARLLLEGRRADAAGHLALYAEVDVALDTFPYHGTTTTCEALWMGRPVVVLEGCEHRSRVGVSLLHAAGHPEWIARDEEAYLRVAVELAGDHAGRVALAGGMRAALAGSALLDHAGRARDFERALLSCHEERALPAGE